MEYFDSNSITIINLISNFYLSLQQKTAIIDFLCYFKVNINIIVDIINIIVERNLEIAGCVRNQYSDSFNLYYWLGTTLSWDYMKVKY